MSIAGLELARKTLINEFYPDTESFTEDLYTLDDVVHQLIFEIIKEEYKRYAPKKTVMDFLGEYDVDGSNRKYTRALQYAQYYRDHYNSHIEDEFGVPDFLHDREFLQALLDGHFRLNIPDVISLEGSPLDWIILRTIPGATAISFCRSAGLAEEFDQILTLRELLLFQPEDSTDTFQRQRQTHRCRPDHGAAPTFRF